MASTSFQCFNSVFELSEIGYWINLCLRSRCTLVQITCLTMYKNPCTCTIVSVPMMLCFSDKTFFKKIDKPTYLWRACMVDPCHWDKNPKDKHGSKCIYVLRLLCLSRSTVRFESSYVVSSRVVPSPFYTLPKEKKKITSASLLSSMARKNLIKNWIIITVWQKKCKLSNIICEKTGHKKRKKTRKKWLFLRTNLESWPQVRLDHRS